MRVFSGCGLGCRISALECAQACSRFCFRAVGLGFRVSL